MVWDDGFDVGGGMLSGFDNPWQPDFGGHQSEFGGLFADDDGPMDRIVVVGERPEQWSRDAIREFMEWLQ